MRNKVKNIIKNILLIFVFVSIGFALGKHSVKNEQAADNKSRTAVQVYYLHSSFRCVTCNTIEKMTKELLEKQFKKELDSGMILFSEVDFQKNEDMAKRFGVISSCVVAAAMKDGQIIDFRRLDEVWTLMSNPTAFDKYISDAIEAMRQKLSEVKK